MAVMIDLRGSSANTENLLRIRSGSANRLKETVHFPVFPDIPVVPDTPETFQTFQSFMTFQPFQAILQFYKVPSISRESNPLQHSPTRMHILHILQFDWFPQKTPPRTSWAITNILQTFILQRKGDVAISVRIDIFSRIELTSSNVLSSRVANYKNDIQ